MYDTVNMARKAAIGTVRSGELCRNVDLAGRSIIDASRFRGRFIHGMGHGIGLEIHDHPGFNAASELVLRKGMAMTIEPGIYLKGFGGVRVEDDIIVCDSSARILTGHAPEELIEVG
jgi:Xaa-Pro dipeptidase